MPPTSEVQHALEGISQVALTGQASYILLILTVIWSLVVCFFGYVIYRLVLVGMGLNAGVVVGALLVTRYIPNPSGLDFLVPCLGLALLLALMSWFLYRTMLSAIIVLAAGILIDFQAIQRADAWQFVVIGFVGLIVAVLAFIYLRPIFIFLTGLVGSFLAVLIIALITAGYGSQLFWQKMLHPGQGGGWQLCIITTAAGVVLAVLGMISQVKISRMFRSRLAPKAPKAARKTSSNTRPARLRI